MAAHVAIPSPAHGEPAHQPKAPDTVKPIEDPTHKSVLTDLSTTMHTQAEVLKDLLTSEAIGRGRTEITNEELQSIRERAEDYSLTPYEYWTEVKVRSGDRYLYVKAGSPDQLKSLLAQLQDTDKNLQAQFKDWAIVTNPYADVYDVDGIEKVGRDLTDTLKIASSYLSNQLRDLPADKNNPDLFFIESMLAAVSGLAEQISSRLADLAQGNTIPNVTLTNTTIQVMNRAAKDNTQQTLQTHVDALLETSKALKELTADKVAANLDTYYTIEENRRALNVDPDRADYSQRDDALRKELENSVVAPFFDALAELTGGGKDAELTKGRDTLQQLKWKLSRVMPDQERTVLLAQRNKLLQGIFKKLQANVDAPLQQESQKLKDYKAKLQDSMDKYGAQPKVFWSTVKNDTLDKIERLGDSEKRELLDKAFGTGGLSGLIEDWLKVVSDFKSKPDDVHKAARDLVAMAENYIGKVNDLLTEDLRPSILQLKYELICALTAIKLDVARSLQYQLKFNSRFN